MVQARKLKKLKQFLRNRRMKVSQNFQIKSIFNRFGKKDSGASILVRKARPDEEDVTESKNNTPTGGGGGRILVKIKIFSSRVTSSLKVTLRKTSTWCNHNRVLTVVISSATVIVISYFVVPVVRPVLVAGKNKVLKLVFKRSIGTTDIDSMKEIPLESTPVQPPGGLTRQRIVGCLLTLAGIAGCLVLVRVGVSLKSASIDFDDTCENVSFIFEDSLTGEAVNFATEASEKYSGVSIPIASITNGVVYVFNGAASIAAYAGTLFIGRLELSNCSPLLELDCKGGFPTSNFVSLLTSSAPVRFIIHQQPIIKILNFIGFHFPQFGPYQILDLFMYHPATNIFADILPEESLWSWKTILSVLREQVPSEEADILINNAMWDLTWGTYTPVDLFSLHPSLKVFSAK